MSSPLDEITEGTPHRFRIWVAVDAVEQALETLTAPDGLARELSAEARGEPDERGQPLDVASTFSPRTAAVLLPLNVLHRAGARVFGFDALDLVTDIAHDALVDAVAAWATYANRGPHRHRLEVLAGEALLERCMRGLRTADERGPNGRPAWRFTLACVAANTPGAVRPMLEAALAAPASDAPSLVDPGIHRAQVARLTNAAIEVPEDVLATLIRRRDYVSERAAYLAGQLRAPLSETITDALCDAAIRGGESSAQALYALAHAPRTDRVHATLERVLASEEPNAMAAALGPFARHWPDDARPVWRRFLSARSINLRWAAEQTLGIHGSKEDVPDAAAQLAKLVRTASKLQASPPRGAEIVELLVRHAEQPDARAALGDLSARWDRLPPDLRQWLDQHHPDLQPSVGR